MIIKYSQGWKQGNAKRGVLPYILLTIIAIEYIILVDQLLKLKGF